MVAILWRNRYQTTQEDVCGDRQNGAINVSTRRACCAPFAHTPYRHKPPRLPHARARAPWHHTACLFYIFAARTLSLPNAAMFGGGTEHTLARTWPRCTAARLLPVPALLRPTPTPHPVSSPASFILYGQFVRSILQLIKREGVPRKGICFTRMGSV